MRARRLMAFLGATLVVAPSPAATLFPLPLQTENPAPPQAATLSLEERADLFMARKSYAEALDYYQRALKECKFKDPRLWNKKGIAHSNLQEFDQARRAYREAIRLKKDFAEAYNNIGTTYYLTEKPKKALKWYRQAIHYNSGNPAFHYNLGTALYATKKYEEAVKSYQTVLDLDPGFFTARASVGTTLQARPADAKYYFYVAKVFAQKGRSDDAVRYLRRAMEEGFKDFDLLDKDPDFKTLALYPPYIELRAAPPKPL
jgi:tetratricopeptide (TPR) repeat protein